LTVILGTSTDAALGGDCGVISFAGGTCKMVGAAMHCR